MESAKERGVEEIEREIEREAMYFSVLAFKFLQQLELGQGVKNSTKFSM